MHLLETHKTIIRNHKNPCFIVDFYTNKIIYSNERMKKMLKGRSDVLGKYFYNVIVNKKDPNGTDLLQELHSKSIYNQSIYDEKSHKGFDVTYVTVNADNSKLLFIEYDSFHVEPEHNIQITLAERMSKLEMADDSKIRVLLQLLCEAYQGDCAYVHLVDHESKTIKLNSNWLKETITDTSKYLIQDIEDVAGFDGLMLWASARDANGILDCDINREESPQQLLDKIALTAFGRHNLKLCGISNKQGQLIATISIGDCATLEISHTLLQYVTLLINDILFIKGKK